jgi:tetratricopeptide (TPR) repeat protein
MNVASRRFRAFISYSHRDKAVVRWLHRALETYRIPRKLVGQVTSVGAVPPRLAPIFRDRDELSASSDLSSELRARLEQTLFLIVVCSPASAKSTYVNEEVLAFKCLHGESRVLALIVAGEPGGPSTEGPDGQCFPLALRFRLDAQGQLSNIGAEPIAADLRKHADGKRLALLKLIAGLTGLPLDELVRREAQRRIRRLTTVAIASLGAAVLTGGLAVYANKQRIEADKQRAQAESARHVAERESAAAKAAADFLVSTFTISNPATENPRTITALTILERSAERAHADLSGQPGIQLRLVTTIARAYENLGLWTEARNAIESALPTIQAMGAEGVPALLTLAHTLYLQGHFEAATETVQQAEKMLGPDPSKYLDSRGYAAEVLAAIDDDGNMQPAKAIFEYDRALRIYAQIPDVAPRIVARVLNNRGLVLSALARFDDAKASLLRANALWRTNLGDNHLVVGQSFEALAENAQNAGKLAEGQEYISRSVSILQHVLDTNNPILADSLLMQGVIFDGEKKTTDARESLHQALGVYKKSYGGPHFKIGIAEVYLSQVDSELGNTSQALADLDDAKHNYDASYGHLHANHGDLLVYRAMVLKRANRMAEARRDCAQGLDIIKQVGDGDSGLYKADAEMCRTL